MDISIWRRPRKESEQSYKHLIGKKDEMKKEWSCDKINIPNCRRPRKESEQKYKTWIGNKDEMKKEWNSDKIKISNCRRPWRNPSRST